MDKIIGNTKTYLGNEIDYLSNIKVLIKGIIRNGVLSGTAGYDPDTEDAYIDGDEFLAEKGGITVNDRVEVQPWVVRKNRFSTVSCYPRVVDLEIFVNLK